MYESNSQKEVSSAIIQQEADSMTVGITDNHNAVLVKVNGEEAAYTANEARELAHSIRTTSDQRWPERAVDAIQYLEDIADVVDGEQSEEAITEKWHTEELQHE